MLNDDEKELIEFIGQYQYISMTDVPVFIKSTYYRIRVQRLIQNKFLRKYSKYLALSTKGRAYMESIGKPVAAKTEYRKQYIKRVIFISHLAAQLQNNKTVSFIPSIMIKDKEIFTEKSRRFVRCN